MRLRPASIPLLLLPACVQPVTRDEPGPDVGGEWSIADAVEYRDDLAAHPGCSTDGMSYPASTMGDYRCAARSYPADAADPSLPIVLLIHGNSDTPDSWQRFPADRGEPMVAEALIDLGYEVHAIDFRIDRVDDPQSNNESENAARNIDHGWSTPIAEEFIRATIAAYPGRRVSLIGFSLGTTVIRDALRRLHVGGEVNPWPHLQDVVLLAGANHGVSTYARLCGVNPTMRGEVACELGSRDGFAPTDFMNALNGADGAYETPCGDGVMAFGEADVCGGNTVQYTTIVMQDIEDGSYQDEFVSEASSALRGADNRLIELTDVDESGYFFDGLLKNHYGAARSRAALDLMVEVLAD